MITWSRLGPGNSTRERAHNEGRVQRVQGRLEANLQAFSKAPRKEGPWICEATAKPMRRGDSGESWRLLVPLTPVCSCQPIGRSRQSREDTRASLEGGQNCCRCGFAGTYIEPCRCSQNHSQTKIEKLREKFSLYFLARPKIRRKDIFLGWRPQQNDSKLNEGYTCAVCGCMPAGACEQASGCVVLLLSADGCLRGVCSHPKNHTQTHMHACATAQRPYRSEYLVCR